MTAFVQRLKNLFKRNPRPTQLPPGSFPGNSEVRDPIGTIPKPSFPTDDDDDDEDIESVGNYNVPEQTQLHEQTRNTDGSEETSQSGNPYGRRTPMNRGLINPSNTTFRNPTNNFTPRMPMNNNLNNNNSMKPPLNTNMGPNTNPPVRPGLPFLSQIEDPSTRATPNPPFAPTNNTQPPLGGFPPGMNLNQSRTTPTIDPQPSAFAKPPPSSDHPPDVNSNSMNLTPPNNFQTSENTLQPPTNNNPMPPPPATPQPQPQSYNVGGPTDTNNQPASFTPPYPINNPNATTNASQRLLPKQMSTFRNRSNDDINGSRLELDYPIENVLIDANIPSSMAFKINDAVEHDRYGNTHHVHRYSFEPSSQQISYKNDRSHHRHLGKHSHHGAMRHIREINNNDTHHHHHRHDNDTRHRHDNDTHHRHDNYTHHRHRHNDYNQNSLFIDPVYPPTTNAYYPEYQDHSELALNQYVDQLLHAPGSVVIQANGIVDVHRILDQHPPMNPPIPTQPFLSPFQSNISTLTEPVFYYTARALPFDPMRTY